MQYVGHMITNESAVIVVDGGLPITVTSDKKQYKIVCNHLRKKRFDKAVAAAEIASAITAQSKGRIVVKDGRVLLGRDKLPSRLSTTLLRLVDTGKSTLPFERFWMKLKKNPSARAKECLFDFMYANNIPLTRDGDLVCYKKVGSNFKDCYTGTFDNSIGKPVHMARKEVDPDPNQTCSKGLHVAAFQYAKHEYSGAHLLVVRVHPKDVVAVPKDYNAQKMRVCAYQVLATTDKELDDVVYFAGSTLKTTTIDAPSTFIIKADKAGRLTIPARVIKMLGATRDGKVRVINWGGFLHILARRGWDKKRSEYQAQFWGPIGVMYAIGKGSIRISLSSVGMKEKEYVVEPGSDFAVVKPNRR